MSQHPTMAGEDARAEAIRAILPTLPVPPVASDALLGPLLAGSSKHRQIFAARTGGVTLEHLRLDPAKGMHDINEVRAARPGDFASAPVIAEPALYAGTYSEHFGHMLAENMHRLWATAVYPALKDARIAFQVREGREAEVPPWMIELLAIYGIARAQLLFVNRPMRFAELHIPRQGRVLGGAMPIEGYAGLFPLQPIAPEPKPGRGLYVSRRQHMYSGSYLGESLIETMLGRAGYEIVYPETLPLRATLGKLASARAIIFCEGSAIHNLELTGRIDARVFVIGRRGGTTERFGRVLDAACADWTVFDRHGSGVCLDWDKGRNSPMRSRGCSFIDLAALTEALAAFADLPLPVPDESSVRRAESLDLLRFLIDPRTGETATDEQLGRMLRALRRGEGVRKLLPKPRRSRVVQSDPT